MRVLLHILICLALGLVGFIQAKSKYDDDIWYNHGNSLAEVWMGRAAVDMGDLTNQDMYDVVWKELQDRCPSMGVLPSQSCNYDTHTIPTHHQFPTKTGVIGSWISYNIEGRYWSEDERTLLIHTMADTLRHVVSSDKNTYNIPGQSKNFATGPDFVRINLPSHDGRPFPFMYLRLRNPSFQSPHRRFYCCPSRTIVDTVLDSVGGNYKAIYPGKNFSRDVRCLIDHMKTCEDCGSKCNACSYQCPDVCPKGQC